MEEIWAMAEWRESLGNVGLSEHLESFFDTFPYEGDLPPNETITPEERTAIAQVHKLVSKAYNATPNEMTNEEYIATGWPQRIEPFAEQALRLMLKRGRFSESHVEAKPSSDDGWPWCDRWLLPK
jgi:hypothetical protein